MRHTAHPQTTGHPDLSHPEPGGYLGMAQEYPRLARALKLDRRTALMSASWGAGQIMGFNHVAAGAAGSLPDVEVRRAQLYLTYLGFAPGAVDGLHGKRSRSAVAAFRQQHGFGTGERVDAALLQALQQRVAAL